MLDLLLLTAQESLSSQLHNSPLIALGVLFGAGLLTSLTPCVYPMIPITAGIVAGAGGNGQNTSKLRVLGVTLTYVSGLALFYAILGLIAGLTGSLFGTVSANPWVRLAVGNLLVIFALAMFDVFPVAAPQKVVAWAGRITGGSLPGIFALGATSGIVAAPCGAPAFAAVLTWVGTTGSPVWGFIYLFVFSMGMTALLIVVGLSSGFLSALPKAGRWMVWVKRASGLLLLGVAEYYFINVGMVL